MPLQTVLSAASGSTEHVQVLSSNNFNVKFFFNFVTQTLKNTFHNMQDLVDVRWKPLKKP